jgi:3-methylcrotonyl-CoA carboxylase alpha subunit
VHSSWCVPIPPAHRAPCDGGPDGAAGLPATGTLHVARWPKPHVAFERSDTQPRIDRGFGEGDAISPWCDSIIAKLIVWGEKRAQALTRLDAALRDTRLVGLNANVAFLRRVVASRAFATADLDTALIERERAALLQAPPLAFELAARRSSLPATPRAPRNVRRSPAPTPPNRSRR